MADEEKYTTENNIDVTQDTQSWDNYGFNLMNGGSGGAYWDWNDIGGSLGSGYNSFTSYFGSIGHYTIGDKTEDGTISDIRYVSYEDMSKEWAAYGNTFNENWRSYDSYFSGITNFWNFFPTVGSALTNGDFWKDTGSNVLLILQAAGSAVGLAASQAANIVITGRLDNMLAGAEATINEFYGTQINFSEQIGNTLESIAQNVGGDSVFMSTLGKGISIFSEGGLRQYKNGVSETSFGMMMENTWKKGSSNSFTQLIAANRIRVSETTPFDAGENLVNLYGNMLLGVPPIFNNIVDPKNRAMAQTIIRDSKFLTLTPGFPKYNGTVMLQASNDDAYHQTKTPEAMLAYLTKNGLDESFATKDRRYYTFKTDYEEYYSYLETMLNTMWIKMGLSASGPTTHNIFSFFTELAGGQLKPQYRTSFGFYVNPQGVVTEAISNNQTGFGAANKAEVDSAADVYQQINYITGMGTGGPVREAMAMTSKAMGLTRNMIDWVKDIASNTIDVWQSERSLISKAIFSIPAVLKDTQRFFTEKDQGVTLQSFATTNGMKVQYPELWADSSVARSININFEFISPYGDPLSIFQYVLAPFAALFCYACPRQAAENGYVSPFFVRADIPGLFTSDLAMISDFTFTRGGSGDIWTKDGLPRAISGSFTILDLYPYLAMTKRLSFLSANPNYTVFLDSLTGLHAVNTGESNDALNEYWKKLLGRVNGLNNDTALWNRYSPNSILANNKYAVTPRTNRLGGNTKNSTSSTWLRGIK